MVSPPNDKDDDFLRLADEFFIYSQVEKSLKKKVYGKEPQIIHLQAENAAIK